MCNQVAGCLEPAGRKCRLFGVLLQLWLNLNVCPCDRLTVLLLNVHGHDSGPSRSCTRARRLQADRHPVVQDQHTYCNSFMHKHRRSQRLYHSQQSLDPWAVADDLRGAFLDCLLLLCLLEFAFDGLETYDDGLVLLGRAPRSRWGRRSRSRTMSLATKVELTGDLRTNIAGDAELLSVPAIKFVPADQHART